FRSGTGTILDDDTPVVPVVSIGSGTVTEGAPGTTTPINFIASLSAPTANTVTVKYATANVKAIAPGDYLAASGTLTFPPGTTKQTVPVTVNGDALDEANETFRITLSSPVRATLGTTTGTGTILDDDPPPSVTIGDVSVAEGTDGATTP